MLTAYANTSPPTYNNIEQVSHAIPVQNLHKCILKTDLLVS